MLRMNADAGVAVPGPVSYSPDGGALVSLHRDVCAVLADPRYAVRPAGEEGPYGTSAWLRSAVCRFSEGASHARRRAVAADGVAHLDPDLLQRSAAELTSSILEDSGGAPVDVASVASRVPVTVLARALGAGDPGAVAAAVPAASVGYLTGGERPDGTDAAVARLVELFGPDDGEVVANRIALLLQAYDATAALIAATLRAAAGLPDPAAWPAAALVAETLRHDPPVRAMRRVTVEDVELAGFALPAGTAVTLDIAAANRDPAVFTDPGRFDPGRVEPAHLTFGAGRRPCPGSAQALHLAAGVVEAVIRLCPKVSAETASTG